MDKILKELAIKGKTSPFPLGSCDKNQYVFMIQI